MFDVSIHNGAAVQKNAYYHALKPAKVTSAIELLSVVTILNF